MKKISLLTALALATVVTLCAAANAQPTPDPGKGPPVDQVWEHRVPGPGMGPGPGMFGKHFGPEGMGPGMGMGWRHRGPEGMGMGMPGGVRFYIEGGARLGLSEAQISQLRTMCFEFEKASVKRRADLETAQIELEQLRSAESADAKKVEAQIREVFTKSADLAVAAFEAQLAADKVLTDEQRAKMKAWGGHGGHGEHDEHGEH